MASFQTAGDAAANVSINAVTLRKCLWSTDGHIVVGRIVNSTVNAVIYNLCYTGIFDNDAAGIASGHDAPLDYANSTLYITHSSANSVVTLKLKKQTVPQAEWSTNIVPGEH